MQYNEVMRGLALADNHIFVGVGSLPVQEQESALQSGKQLINLNFISAACVTRNINSGIIRHNMLVM